MAPEPTDLRPLEGDLAPLLFARDSSRDGEGDSLDAIADAAHSHKEFWCTCVGKGSITWTHG